MGILSNIASAVNIAVRAVTGLLLGSQAHIGDYVDYFKITPSDFSIMFVPEEEGKVSLNLALMQGLNYSLSKNVLPLTFIEVPYYAGVWDGRIIGQGVVSRMFTTPIELEGFQSNLGALFTELDRFFLVLPKRVDRAEEGKQLYESAKAGGLLDFLEGLATSVVQNIANTLNDLVPFLEMFRLLKGEVPMEDFVTEVQFMDCNVTNYSFSMAAGNVACLEAMSFLITHANLDRSVGNGGN